jgi:hypothetical protein
MDGWLMEGWMIGDVRGGHAMMCEDGGGRAAIWGSLCGGQSVSRRVGRQGGHPFGAGAGPEALGHAG